MKRIPILIVEGHVAVREALEALLRSSPSLEVVGTAQTITEGGVLGQIHGATLLLYGVQSGMNQALSASLEKVRELQQGGWSVIVLSSYCDSEERELFLQAGARRYLLKDINSSLLIGEIEAVSRETAVA